MKNILFLLLFSSVIMSQTNKDMCVTIDDLPFQQNGTTSIEMQNYYTQKLLNKLTSAKIPAVGFVNENKLETDGKLNPAKLELLKLWLDSGLELGNHTYSHKGLHNSSVAEFEADILRGETHIKPMIKEAGSRLRYFRHPYLHTGRSIEIKDSVNNFLQENGYIVASVTIDNSEWIYAFSYQKAMFAGDSLMMKEIAAEYIPYMIDKIKFYERQSDKLFGRNIKHILLIHSNALNADYIDLLLSQIKKEGYNFISLEETLRDEVFLLPDKFTGGAGISWIDRWALAKGMKKDFFAGEPRISSRISEYSGYKE
ncbi:MAG: polysaccharide deacetylase family protein [Melioribacteraceae bacterium]|nr:polysaccharide deacetylase family protein [Melioribacteraceae bacterium]